MDKVIIFEEMPQAITALLCKVETIQNDINELKRHKAETPAEYIIGIDEACKILHRAKSTVYSVLPARQDAPVQTFGTHGMDGESQIGNLRTDYNGYGREDAARHLT